MVTDMINLILIDTGYPRYIGRFHIKMQAPVTQEEIDRKQDLSNTLRNISDIMNTLNDVQTTSSKLKILKSLLSECLSDQEITSILQDEIDKLELEESKNQSTDNESNDTPLGNTDDFGGFDAGNDSFENSEPFPSREEPTGDEQEDLTDVESENSAIEEPLTPETPATEDDNLPSFSDLGVDGTINQ